MSSTESPSLFETLLAERVLVLDGAMGTMVQRYTSTEADFRGARFRAHGKELKGKNDLLLSLIPILRILQI